MAGGGDHEQVRALYPTFRMALQAIAQGLVGADDAAAAVDDAMARFEEMLPDLAYANRPDAPMATSLIWCSAFLALWLVLEPNGTDVHDFGRAVNTVAKFAPEPEDADFKAPSSWMADWQAAAAESQQAGRTGEFVFEMVPGDAPGRWGMNILSCAICHQFGKFGAMDLVPYMCANDDVMSDNFGHGLRRTGTIALGAHHCDFRYGNDEPARVADLFPDRIRLSSP